MTEQIDAPTDYTLEVVEVEYSLDELSQLVNDISKYAWEHGATIAGEANPADDRAHIKAPDTIADDLRRIYGTDPRLVIDGGFKEIVPDGATKDDYLGYNLVEGGQANYFYTNTAGLYRFTSGFAVESGYGPFIATAGHYGYYDTPAAVCPAGRTFRQGTLSSVTYGLLGTVAVCQYGGNIDAALVTTATSGRNN